MLPTSYGKGCLPSYRAAAAVAAALPIAQSAVALTVR